MVITIDGPAGSGKSTVARRVAKCLATPHVDTGAMYRVVTLLSLEQDLSLDNAKVLGTLARSTQIEVRTDSDGENIVLVNGRDVTREIRSPEVSRNVSLVAAHREVRETSGERVSLVTSRPLTSTMFSPSESVRTSICVERASVPSTSALSRDRSCSKLSNVTTLYMAPVSTWGVAKHLATLLATVLLPEPAGPSIVMTIPV